MWTHADRDGVIQKFMNFKCDLQEIPGVGKSISKDLQNIGIKCVADLRGKDPKRLYDQSNKFAGTVQDRCLLYVFRCAIYFAEHKNLNPEKLKWWNWKDKWY